MERESQVFTLTETISLLKFDDVTKLIVFYMLHLRLSERIINKRGVPSITRLKSIVITSRQTCSERASKGEDDVYLTVLNPVQPRNAASVWRLNRVVTCL